MTLEDRLRTVFARALDLEPGIDLDAVRYRGHPHWDSLGHMSLIAEIENEFEVEIGPDEIIRIDSFEAAVKVLQDVGADV